MTLIELVKGNSVSFVSLKSGVARYKLKTVNRDFLFDVPVADMGDGEFLRDDRAEPFMRWIRQALESGSIDSQITENDA